MNTSKKYDNWKTLNVKVFAKFKHKFSLSEFDIKNVVECKPGAIEIVLKKVKNALEKFAKDPPQALKFMKTKEY